MPTSPPLTHLPPPPLPTPLQEYMRNIMTIEPKWLVELAPQFYKSADPNKMTRQKRMQKIEPLYDRFNPPNSWRLSKRKG